MVISTVEKKYVTVPEIRHSSYKITYVESNRTRIVPLDPDNTDYQEIQEWAKIEGNNIIDNGA
jgi:hypothetical protein